MDTSYFSLNFIIFTLYARQTCFVKELDKNVLQNEDLLAV